MTTKTLVSPKLTREFKTKKQLIELILTINDQIPMTDEQLSKLHEIDLARLIGGSIKYSESTKTKRLHSMTSSVPYRRGMVAELRDLARSKTVTVDYYHDKAEKRLYLQAFDPSGPARIATEVLKLALTVRFL